MPVHKRGLTPGGFGFCTSVCLFIGLPTVLAYQQLRFSKTK